MFSRPTRPMKGSEQTVVLPAPTGGLNTSSPAMNMAATDCMLLFNMLAAENGLRARLGSREWVTGLTGASDSLVRTVIPYAGSSATASRLFVTTSKGIWNVSTSTATPSGPALAFATTAGDSGYGVAHGHTTTAGNFIWYADEVNGLHLYTESTDTWAAVSNTSITGVDPADVCFVTVFKGFTFFVEKNTAQLWILPVNSIAGETNRLGIGYKLQAGGDIVGVWSWTYDGGSGLDDAMVVVTRGGDVIVFQGTDPTTSTNFGISGVWGVGKMPAGRNIATSFGGDLLLLTRSGIVPMSKLVLGRVPDASQYETARIHNLFNGLMLSQGDIPGWSIVLHPEESALLVTVPTGAGQATTQLAMSLATRSWSRLRDLDIYACASYEGKLYYGTVDGKVGINDGNVDGVTLASPNTYEAIQYSGIGAFNNFSIGSQKQVHIIKPYFTAGSAAPSFSVGARYDFDVTELAEVSLSASTGSVWDTGTWDSATWGTVTASTGVRGAAGIGSNVAVAWRGASVDRTILTGFEVSFSTGGML